MLKYLHKASVLVFPKRQNLDPKSWILNPETLNPKTPNPRTLTLNPEAENIA